MLSFLFVCMVVGYVLKFMFSPLLQLGEMKKMRRELQRQRRGW